LNESRYISAFLAVYVPSNTTFLLVSFTMNSTVSSLLFSREALASVTVRSEKDIDPAAFGLASSLLES
jgi:hypothetical protein